jgi:Fe-S oxidoreductase
MESYACTWCGRCHIACPAQTSGKPLSPRELVLGTKEHLLMVGPSLLKAAESRQASSVDAPGDGGDTQYAAGPPFVGSVISEDAIWSCTTCRACQEVCPSYNEQMGTIIDLRRHLQMITTTETGRETLKNLRVRAHPWRGTMYARADWAEGLDVKIVGEDGPTEILYWVGCTQALEDRNLKVAQAIARLMKEAGIDFGILGEEEMCCGDPARRLGAEHIFQMMVANNIQLLDGYGVKKIVTACPHCFNTLKNEYPEFGGRFEVIHHSHMLADLVVRGRLATGTTGQETLTYQDPCYLGRYNDLYEPARQLLRGIPGKTLVEMEKNRLDGFCCGGGGGRMWLEESVGTRINTLRLSQAHETGATVVATACPYCLQMLEDAARGEDGGGSPRIRDIAEILADAVEARSLP